MNLKKIHLIAGLIFILVFLLTGQYMHHIHNHLHDMEAGPRMLFRSGHIYILLAAVMNILYGYNYTPSLNKRLRVLSHLASAILLSSLVLFTIGFFFEPNLENFVRPWSRPSLYLLFGLGLVMGVIGLRNKNPNG